MGDSRTCRICLGDGDDGGRLISPCLCRGTMRYVHVECLEEWRRTSQNRRSFWQCDQCKYKYKLSRIGRASVLTSKCVRFGLAVLGLVAIIFVSGFVGKIAIPATASMAWGGLQAGLGVWDDDVTAFSDVDEEAMAALVERCRRKWATVVACCEMTASEEISLDRCPPLQPASGLGAHTQYLSASEGFLEDVVRVCGGALNPDLHAEMALLQWQRCVDESQSEMPSASVGDMHANQEGEGDVAQLPSTWSRWLLDQLWFLLRIDTNHWICGGTFVGLGGFASILQLEGRFWFRGGWGTGGVRGGGGGGGGGGDKGNKLVMLVIAVIVVIGLLRSLWWVWGRVEEVTTGWLVATEHRVLNVTEEERDRASRDN